MDLDVDLLGGRDWGMGLGGKGGEGARRFSITKTKRGREIASARNKRSR